MKDAILFCNSRLVVTDHCRFRREPGLAVWRGGPRGLTSAQFLQTNGVWRGSEKLLRIETERGPLGNENFETRERASSVSTTNHSQLSSALQSALAGRSNKGRWPKRLP